MTLAAYGGRRRRPLMESLAASSRETYNRELRLRILPSLDSVDVRNIDRARMQHMLDAHATDSVARMAIGRLNNEARSDRLTAFNPATSRHTMPSKAGSATADLRSKRSLRRAPPSRRCAGETPTALVRRSPQPTTSWELSTEERYGFNWENLDRCTGRARLLRLSIDVARGGHARPQGAKNRARRPPHHPLDSPEAPGPLPAGEPDSRP